MAITQSFSDLLIQRGASLRSALTQLDRTALGFLIVVDEWNKLSAVLTDGDIRRAFLRGVALDDPIDRAMQGNCVSMPVEATAAEISAALTGKITFLPLVDREGHPVDYASVSRHRRYPVMEPALDGNEADYVQECVQTGWVSSQGRFVGLFERMMADLHGVPYALAVSNGTCALHLALVSLGIGPGDEVIVPDLTFASTANVVIHAGATPVLVDVDPETWNMDASAVQKALTERTRAIMPVHLYGHPCDMDPLMALARERNLYVIEDAAEALGAGYKGKIVGSFGNAACFSFFGNKTITTGEGGIILFKDGRVAERARILRDHGMSKERRYWHLEVGYNYRLTNLQAAIGVAQLERIDSILKRKRAVAARYNAELKHIPKLGLPPSAPWANSAYWLYTIQLSDDLGISRDALAERLLLNGIETRPVFYPLHQMPLYQRYCAGGEFPNADRLSRAGLSLPSAVTMRDLDIDAVVAKIDEIVRVHQMADAAGTG